MEVQKAVERMLACGFHEARGHFGLLHRGFVTVERETLDGVEYAFGTETIVLVVGQKVEVVWRAVTDSTASLTG